MACYSRTRHTLNSVFVVHQGSNPSTDFFIAPLLRAKGEAARFYSFHETPAPGDLAGATVVFVRYVPPAWKSLLSTQRPAQVVLFMDDDLFDSRAFKGMPWHYQRKLFRLAWRHQRWLRHMGAKLWVSSPWLAQKYADWKPVVLEPGNPHPLPERPPEPHMKTLFYHGSASHSAELAWLEPVVEKVLSARQDVCFEVIGDRKVRDRFSHLSGVHVVHPMGWPAYQAFIQRPGRTIGLAPLLDSSFNAARAPTKFFDITAAGAVGLYGDTPIYQRLVTHGVNGMMLPMDSQEAWGTEILSLLASQELRQKLYSNARH